MLVPAVLMVFGHSLSLDIPWLSPGSHCWVAGIIPPCASELSQCKGVLRAFVLALLEITTLGNELHLPPAK